MQRPNSVISVRKTPPLAVAGASATLPPVAVDMQSLRERHATVPHLERSSTRMDIAGQKAMLYRRTLAEARGFGLEVVEAHSAPDKPWGAYLRLAEASLPAFYDAYWQGADVPAPTDGLKLDPKILIVAPATRLSLQYHHRRSELWRVLDGPVKVVVGDRDSTLQDITVHPGEVIRIGLGQWHRLVGMESWGRVAEIWQHADPDNPSGEDDIVRVQDDFGR